MKPFHRNSLHGLVRSTAFTLCLPFLTACGTDTQVHGTQQNTAFHVNIDSSIAIGNTPGSNRSAIALAIGMMEPECQKIKIAESFLKARSDTALLVTAIHSDQSTTKTFHNACANGKDLVVSIITVPPTPTDVANMAPSSHPSPKNIIDIRRFP